MEIVQFIELAIQIYAFCVWVERNSIDLAQPKVIEIQRRFRRRQPNQIVIHSLGDTKLTRMSNNKHCLRRRQSWKGL